jgi:hypothetical protein
MKFKFTFALIFTFALALVSAVADPVVIGGSGISVPPPTIQTLVVESNGIVVGSGQTQKDLIAAGKDIWSTFQHLRPFTTNGNATVRIGIGQNTTSHEWVEAVMVTLPLNESGSLNAGVVGANIGGTFYEGGANLSIGVTNNWPLLGTVKTIAGDGVVYNFRRHEPANYAFAGFEKEWRISSRWEAGVGIVTANTSDQPGVDIIGGVHLTYWWGKKTQ